MTGKARLDQLLVDRGMFATRSRARDAVRSGIVRAGGRTATKPGQMLTTDAVIELTETPSPYVSRAALKLRHAIDRFAIDPAGRSALDIGASTGGFTQVLLDAGAAQVTAVDVGHGQFHEQLRDDPRVTLIERLNARDLTADHLATAHNLIVCDVSFISLKLALAPALALAAPGAALVALIKPQFEVGRDGIGKGGIVRDTTLHDRVCAEIRAWIEAQDGWSVTGLVPSPIEGSDGNREFLVSAAKH